MLFGLITIELWNLLVWRVVVVDVCQSMAAVLPDDVCDIGEFDRGGNVFTRVGAASVSDVAVINVVFSFLQCVLAV